YSDPGESSGCGGIYNGSLQIVGGGSTGGTENPGGGNTGSGNDLGSSPGGTNPGGIITGADGVSLNDAKVFYGREGVIYNPNLLYHTFIAYDLSQCLPASMTYIDNNMGGNHTIHVFNNWMFTKQPDYQEYGGFKSEFIPDLIGTYFSTAESLPQGGLYEAIANGHYILMDVPNGKYKNGVPQTHTITVTGYDPASGNLIYMDPYYGYEYEIPYEVVKNTSFVYIINGRR
ncbi:MAG: C39 family peptidase, partial [Rikenellaceae bacterium]|nr:C39 family peptidase [Rikenellaceae bacterium]